MRKRYKNVAAVKDISFGVNRHECFGLLGVNGAGKSTTFRMMTGGEIPDYGTMYLGGKDIKSNKDYVSDCRTINRYFFINETYNFSSYLKWDTVPNKMLL